VNRLNDHELPAKCRVELEPGDVVTIETPGGGGYGAPSA
jgi:N-methylhydantoinase B/oxoprolinase/acetone carboxylase alpha subunit